MNTDGLSPGILERKTNRGISNDVVSKRARAYGRVLQVRARVWGEALSTVSPQQQSVTAPSTIRSRNESLQVLSLSLHRSACSSMAVFLAWPRTSSGTDAVQVPMHYTLGSSAEPGDWHTRRCRGGRTIYTRACCSLLFTLPFLAAELARMAPTHALTSVRIYPVVGENISQPSGAGDGGGVANSERVQRSDFATHGKSGCSMGQDVHVGPWSFGVHAGGKRHREANEKKKAIIHRVLLLLKRLHSSSEAALIPMIVVGTNKYFEVRDRVMFSSRRFRMCMPLLVLLLLSAACCCVLLLPLLLLRLHFVGVAGKSDASPRSPDCSMDVSALLMRRGEPNGSPLFPAGCVQLGCARGKTWTNERMARGIPILYPWHRRGTA